MESYEIIIAVICIVVLCGLVILICACQIREEKTRKEKTSITAQLMKNLSNQKRKESQEKQLQKDIANSQMILNYLPVLIHNTAKKGWSMLELSFCYGCGEGYILQFTGFWGVISALKNTPISSQYMDTMIAKIEKFCKQNGFNIEYDDYDIKISW